MSFGLSEAERTDFEGKRGAAPESCRGSEGDRERDKRGKVWKNNEEWANNPAFARTGESWRIYHGDQEKEETAEEGKKA
jgi:hypothetical protein